MTILKGMENRRPKILLGLAAAVMFLTLGVHVFAGGEELYVPLRASDEPDIIISVFSVVWHFVSLQLGLMAVVLCFLAFRPNGPLFCYVIVSTFGFAALFIFYGLADLGSLWPMPQWIAFLIVGLLMLGAGAQTHLTKGSLV